MLGVPEIEQMAHMKTRFRKARGLLLLLLLLLLFLSLFQTGPAMVVPRPARSVTF